MSEGSVLRRQENKKKTGEKTYSMGANASSMLMKGPKQLQMYKLDCWGSGIWSTSQLMVYDGS